MNKKNRDFIPEDIQIKEIYIYYDRPLLFAGVDRLDHIYIALLSEETDEKEVWLYAPISYRKFQLARSGRIDTKSIYANAESGYVYEVDVPNEEDQGLFVDYIRCEDIPQKWLPPAENYLISNNVEYEETEFIGDPEGLSDAVQMRLNYGVYYQKGIAPASDLASAIQNLQNLINEVGVQISKMKIPMLVTAFGEGSFLVNLRVKDTVTLFNDSPSTRTLQQLFSLLSEEKFQEIKSENWLTNDIRKKLNDFLVGLSGELKDFSLEWKSPVRKYESKIKLKREEIDKLIKEVSSVEKREEIITIAIIGRFRGINLDRKSFNIVTNSGVKYTGYIDDNLMDSKIIEMVRLDQLYYAMIRETNLIEENILETTTKYLLISLEIYAGPR